MKGQMNFLEGLFTIRDQGRSSAFDGNSMVSFPDGVELQNEDNLLCPFKYRVEKRMLFFIG
jgi:hypothetical protein